MEGAEVEQPIAMTRRQKESEDLATASEKMPFRVLYYQLFSRDKILLDAPPSSESSCPCWECTFSPPLASAGLATAAWRLRMAARRAFWR